MGHFSLAIATVPAYDSLIHRSSRGTQMDTIKVQTPEKSIVSNIWTKIGSTMICGYLHEIVRYGQALYMSRFLGKKLDFTK